MNTNTQTVDQLLAPSWLSGLIAILGGLVIAFGVILAFNFSNSQIRQQITGWQSTTTPAVTLPGQTTSSSNSNSLQNTWPLIGFWMIAGLVAYFIVEAVAKGMRDVVEIKNELNYVHVRRDLLMKNTISALFIRFAAAVSWIFFIGVFFKRIVPYSIMAAHASASDPRSLNAILYCLLSFIMIVLSLHLQTILLRLCAGRPRLFSAG